MNKKMSKRDVSRYIHKEFLRNITLIERSPLKSSSGIKGDRRLTSWYNVYV
jgi:hypothetical protein